jgi:hypothetical protein
LAGYYKEENTLGGLLQGGTYPWRVIRVVLNNIHNHNSQRKKKKKYLVAASKTLLTS